MANIADISYSSDSDSDTEEVFPNFAVNFSKAELAETLSEILENYQKLQIKYKNLKHNLLSDSEDTKKLETENSELKKIISELKIENFVFKENLQKAQEKFVSEVLSNTDNILKEYDIGFQEFLAKSIDRSK